MGDDQRFELVELGLRRLVATELQRAFEVVDDRVERTVDVVGRTLEAQRACTPWPSSRSRSALTIRLLPMPGSPDKQHDLPFAILRQLPALQQQGDLMLASD